MADAKSLSWRTGFGKTMGPKAIATTTREKLIARGEIREPGTLNSISQKFLLKVFLMTRMPVAVLISHGMLHVEGVQGQVPLKLPHQISHKIQVNSPFRGLPPRALASLDLFPAVAATPMQLSIRGGAGIRRHNSPATPCNPAKAPLWGLLKIIGAMEIARLRVKDPVPLAIAFAVGAGAGKTLVKISADQVILDGNKTAAAAAAEGRIVGDVRRGNPAALVEGGPLVL